jgi:hypothetical protein
MTRATIILFSAIQKIKFAFGKHSDGYPDEVLPTLRTWDGSIESLRDLYLDCHWDGNFSYWYELNADTGSVIGWEAQTYWVTAPVDWKEKGYNCWVGTNGKYGWTDWRKGKRVGVFTILPTPIQLLTDTQYTSKDLKAFRDMNNSYEVQSLTTHWRNPNKTRTFVSVNNDLEQIMYVEKFDELPLKLNSFQPDSLEAKILKWRLKIGK